MIIKNFYRSREDGINLFITFSDEDFWIQKVGTDEIYDKAIDIESADFTYIETLEKIERLEEDELIDLELEDEEQELTNEEIADLLKEVF